MLFRLYSLAILMGVACTQTIPSIVNAIGPFSLQVLSDSTVNDTFIAIDMAGAFGEGPSYYGLFSATAVTYDLFYLNNTASNSSVATELVANRYQLPYGAYVPPLDNTTSTVQTIEFNYSSNTTSPALFSLDADNHLLYGGESKWLSCDLGYRYGVDLFQLSWNFGGTNITENCVDVTLLCVLG